MMEVILCIFQNKRETQSFPFERDTNLWDSLKEHHFCMTEISFTSII